MSTEQHFRIEQEYIDQPIFVQTFGGEYSSEDFDLAEYGISIHNLNIHGIPPQTMKELAVLMINHLIINGHHFELAPNPHQDMYQELRAIN